MLLHAPAVALPPACPLSTSACYYSPPPSLPLPPTAPPDSNSECPPLAPKFIPPPPPEAGRRVLNVLRRLKEYDFVRESASQSIDCAQRREGGSTRGITTCAPSR